MPKHDTTAHAAYALTGGTVFTGDEFLPDHAVFIEGGTVTSIVPEAELAGEVKRIRANGAIIAPGFVDLQLNGCGGVTFNDSITEEALGIMHAANLKSGCTSFMPTLISTGEDKMLRALELVHGVIAGQKIPGVIGVHLEGPYISPARKGIHNSADIKSLGAGMRDAIAGFARKIPIMLTLAPECVERDDIRLLADSGVTVSIGHSAATYEQARLAVKAGARAATHLFNAMSPFQSREPGMVGAVLNSPDLSCGMLADGHHVHYAALDLSKRLKGDKCFLVTDATAPVGTGMTEFSFGGQTVYVRDGMCVNADGTLGGSMLTMIEAVKNCVSRIGWPPAEVLRMASLYPARLMGLDERLGTIAPGKNADLALFSPYTFEMLGTVDKGEAHIWSGKRELPEA